jgi:selenocysteine lyase/cysteine desulfurase
MTMQPPYDLEVWRRRIPILSSYVLMNHCTQAPQTEATRAAAEAYLESWRRDGVDWDRWMEEVESARAQFAQLIHASPEEIAVTTSVSAAVSSVASALDFGGERCRVVTSEAEFPTVAHVWLAQRRHGAQVEWVSGGYEGPVDEDSVDERTLVVSATHASYQDGGKQDVAEIAKVAHRAGAYIFVDAYQTAGIHHLNVRELDIDFLAAGTLKFLMGTPGIAFLYVRRELIERLEPTSTGWLGRAQPFEFRARELDYAPSASRFDTGTPPVMAAYVARAGMRMIQDIGTEKIQNWTDQLSARLLAGAAERGLVTLGPHDVRQKTALTAIVCGHDELANGGALCGGDAAVSSWASRRRRFSEVVEERLRERGILASARGPAIRLTPHFYTTAEDVDQALDAVAEVTAAL